MTWSVAKGCSMCRWQRLPRQPTVEYGPIFQDLCVANSTQTPRIHVVSRYNATSCPFNRLLLGAVAGFGKPVVMESSLRWGHTLHPFPTDAEHLAPSPTRFESSIIKDYMHFTLFPAPLLLNDTMRWRQYRSASSSL